MRTICFLSIKSPYKPVGTQTISKWLQKLLVNSHVDTSIFKGYSYRHASTSKAARMGVSVDTIFTKAGWCKGSSVFGRFYNKPLLNDSYCNAFFS